MIKHPLPSALLASAAALIAAIPLRAAEPMGKAADNHIFAQTLVNDTMAQNPDLVILGLHGIAPGAKEETMLASTLDRIGEKDDDEDLVVVKEQEIVLARSLTEPWKFKVHLPLKDASGKIVGLAAVIFKYQEGKDETYYCGRALAVRDSIAKRMPSFEDLFKPTP